MITTTGFTVRKGEDALSVKGSWLALCGARLLLGGVKDLQVPFCGAGLPKVRGSREPRKVPLHPKAAKQTSAAVPRGCCRCVGPSPAAVARRGLPWVSWDFTRGP